MSAYVHGWELWYGSSGRQESDAYGDFENSEHLCGWRSSPLGFATIIKRWQRPQDYIVLAKKSLQDEDFFAVWITIWIEPPYAERHVRWCERGYLLAPTRLGNCESAQSLFFNSCEWALENRFQSVWMISRGKTNWNQFAISCGWTCQCVGL